MPKLKLLHLLQPNIPGKQIFIFITNSKQCFWIKENQSDWESIKIDRMEVSRDGGSVTYYFTGKEYNRIFIPSLLRKGEMSYIASKFQSVLLEKISLSEQKLQELGFVSQLETIFDTEKVQREKSPKRDETAKKNLSNFFDILSIDPSTEVLEPGISSELKI